MVLVRASLALGLRVMFYARCRLALLFSPSYFRTRLAYARSRPRLGIHSSDSIHDVLYRVIEVLLRFGASLHFGNFGQQVDRRGLFQAKCCIFLDFGQILDLRPQKVAHDPGASFEHIRLGNGQSDVQISEKEEKANLKRRKKRSANFLIFMP